MTVPSRHRAVEQHFKSRQTLILVRVLLLYPSPWVASHFP